eukprot:TRINITY_DN58747_c0_g1_i1.p1 TRINITY_DN58747_c0_g1~~TRINITY_DN58747_c0_g1_i1.p1  ORF type:complete len:297 (-),score=17.74 TRINITY_DN58747_c0_g1_i1:43-933(-)
MFRGLHFLLHFLFSTHDRTLTLSSRLERVGRKPTFRVLYLCHRPQDEAGVGGFTYINKSSESDLTSVGADVINKAFISPSIPKEHAVAYSFLDPAFQPGFEPFDLASWDEWTQKYGPPAEVKIADGCRKWLNLTGNRNSSCLFVASPLPSDSEGISSVARILCSGRQPCYDSVVSVACPGFLEKDILALNREIMLPGARYYQGNGNTCDIAADFTSRLVAASVAKNASICQYTRSTDPYAADTKFSVHPLQDTKSELKAEATAMKSSGSRCCIPLILLFFFETLYFTSVYCCEPRA